MTKLLFYLYRRVNGKELHKEASKRRSIRYQNAPNEVRKKRAGSVGEPIELCSIMRRRLRLRHVRALPGPPCRFDALLLTPIQ